MPSRRSLFVFRTVPVLLTVISLNSIDVRPAGAYEVRALGTMLTRAEDLLLPLTTVPGPHSSFGGRLGLELEVGQGWSAGPSAQYVCSRFRAESVEGESDLTVSSWSIQFGAGRQLKVSSDLRGQVGPVFEYAETKSDFESRNATALRSESTRWAVGVRLRGELRTGSHFGLFADVTPMVGSAKASNPTQSLNTTWTSTSVDVGIGVCWSPNPRLSQRPTPTTAADRAETR